MAKGWSEVIAGVDVDFKILHASALARLNYFLPQMEDACPEQANRTSPSQWLEVNPLFVLKNHHCLHAFNLLSLNLKPKRILAPPTVVAKFARVVWHEVRDCA
jgi:hypothetical protein